MTITITPDAIEGRFLEEEHRRLRSGLASLGDSIGDAHRMSREDAGDRVARTLTWLHRDVLPHAAWEEGWLYPHLDQAAATPWATRSLRFEHDQIRDLAVSLEREFQALGDRWSAELTFRLVVALTRLETLVAAHLAQEERLVMPLLEVVERQTTGAAIPAI